MTEEQIKSNKPKGNVAPITKRTRQEVAEFLLQLTPTPELPVGISPFLLSVDMTSLRAWANRRCGPSFMDDVEQILVRTSNAVGCPLNVSYINKDILQIRHSLEKLPPFLSLMDDDILSQEQHTALFSTEHSGRLERYEVTYSTVRIKPAAAVADSYPKQDLPGNEEDGGSTQPKRRKIRSAAPGKSPRA